MSRRLLPFTLLASGALVAACGDSQETPTSPEFQVGTGPACSPSNVKQYAKALAGTNSTLYGIAQQFTTQNANKTPGGTTLFFDLAAEAANLAQGGDLDPDHKTALANLLIQGIACADVTVSDASYAALTAAERVKRFFDAAGPDGGLEVRGRPTDVDAPIYSHNQGQQGAAAVNAPAAGFAAWYGDRVMFYGSPIEDFSNEADAVLFETIAFEWFTVRPAKIPFNPDNLSGEVALCVTDEVDDARQLRVQHTQTILPVVTAGTLFPCSDNSEFRLGANKPRTGFAGALAWLSHQFSPEPLHAASVLVATTTPTGRAKSLSPLEVINPRGAKLTYDPGPKDGQVNKPIGVKVHATGTGNTDWEGLLIEIRAQDNNGKFVEVTPRQATTNALGIADFSDSKINKTGVYQLLAVTLPSVDDNAGAFTQDSVLSGNFLQRPK
jgi:hypothetical protein